MSPKVRTAVTHLGTAAGGGLAVVMWMATQGVDLYAIVNQFNVVVKEVTKFVAIAWPFATAGYGVWKASTRQKIIDVAAAAKEDPAAKEAVVAMVDAMPEVAKVITKATPAGEALAMAVPSSTVVAASDPRAKSGL